MKIITYFIFNSILCISEMISNFLFKQNHSLTVYLSYRWYYSVSTDAVWSGTNINNFRIKQKLASECSIYDDIVLVTRLGNFSNIFNPEMYLISEIQNYCTNHSYIIGLSMGCNVEIQIFRTKKMFRLFVGYFLQLDMYIFSMF